MTRARLDVEFTHIICSMAASLVELKKEYIGILTGYLCIPIYQGITSIFEAAVKHKQSNGIATDELRIFQDLLKNVVPKWSPKVLDKEVRRIRTVSKMGTTLDKIFTAIMKATLLVLSCTTHVDELHHVPKQYYTAPVFEAYIHRCYVLSAREFFNYPFLFSKKGDPKLLKDHQKEALSIIKGCIRDAIGHSIPLQEVLMQFLSDKDTIHEAIIPFNNTVSLLASDGTNVMDKVFSTYKIKEAPAPNLPPGENEDAVPSKQEEESRHTITNFLLDDPRVIQSDTLVQSHVIE